MERVAQWVLSFDLATRTGWAKGAPNDRAPMSGAVTLNKPHWPDGAWQHNMRALFLDLIRDRTPDIVIWETPMSPYAWARRAEELGRPQNGESLIMQNSLSDILKGCCHARHILWVTTPRQTILKHYTGRGTWTSGPKAGDGREMGKRAVLERAAKLGHLPPGCKDDDRGDAVATWSYGCGAYGKITPQSLEMFDQGKMKHQTPSLLDGA